MEIGINREIVIDTFIARLVRDESTSRFTNKEIVLLAEVVADAYLDGFERGYEKAKKENEKTT